MHRFLASTLRTIPAAVLALGAATAHADFLNGTSVNLTIGGADVVNLNGGNPTGTMTIPASTTNQGGISATYSAAANQALVAKAQMSGASAAKLIVIANTAYGIKVVPPAGAAIKGAKLILHGKVEGTVTGNGLIHMLASTAMESSPQNGSASLNITDAATGSQEFEMTATVSPFSDNGDLSGRVRMRVVAIVETPGGGSAESFATTKITGFRLTTAAGAPIPGTTMTVDGGAIAELGGAPPSKAAAVEFFNAGLGHYFVTTDLGEIARLDDGTFAGWARTGQSFNVSTREGAGLVPVCRFYTTAFPGSSSHFYTGNAAECDALKQGTTWQFEKIAFYIALPSQQGVCPASTVPVFRLYNNGHGGAPNHRYTTSTDIRSQMLAQGYADEGVIMCAQQ